MVQILIIILISIISNKFFYKKSDKNYLIAQCFSFALTIILFENFNVSYSLYLVLILHIAIILSLPIILAQSPTLVLISHIKNKKNINKNEIEKIFKNTEDKNYKKSLQKLHILNTKGKPTIIGNILIFLLKGLKC